MEPRFGYDFSRVRIHSGATAERSAKDMNAHAYAVGHHIVFSAGEFAPATFAGQRLLAHELAHVVQQSGSHTAGANRQGWGNGNLSTAATHVARQKKDSDDAVEERDAGEGEEVPAKDVLAGTLVTQITVSLARMRAGFHTPLGMILGDVTKIDLAPGTYELTPETGKQQWKINKAGVKTGLRFDVILDGADPWTLRYPDHLNLVVTTGALKEPKTYGDMLNEKGELIDPLWLYEDMPEDMKPRPIEGIDDFESAHYDLDYKSQGGNLSKWLMVHYRDNSTREIHLDSIKESTPRLLAAKQEALRIMDEYNTLFILNTFPTVWFLLTLQPTVSVTSGRPSYKVGRRSVPKARMRSTAKKGGTPETVEAPPTSQKPSAKQVSVPAAEAEAVGPVAQVSDAAKTARDLARKLADEGEPVIANLGGAGAKHEPKNAINVNNQAVSRKNIPNHVNADGTDVGELFGAETLDRIEGHNMAPGVIDWSRAAPGAYKVLKPGGTIQYYYRGANADAEVMGAQLRKAGFTDVEVIGEVLVRAKKPGG